MSLRDEIRQHLEEAIAEGVDHGNLDWKYDRPDADGYADAILALIRERLTSDEVMRELERRTNYASMPFRAILTAALDDITKDTP